MNRPDSSFYKTLGQMLKEARVQKKISTRQLVERSNGEISKGTVTNYERGSPALGNREKLNAYCNALGVDPNEMWEAAESASMVDDYYKDKIGRISVSEDELNLLSNYRLLSDEDKRSAQKYIKYLNQK